MLEPDLFSQSADTTNKKCATCAYLCEEMHHPGAYYCDLSKRGIPPNKAACKFYRSGVM